MNIADKMAHKRKKILKKRTKKDNTDLLVRIVSIIDYVHGIMFILAALLFFLFETLVSSFAKAIILRQMMHATSGFWILTNSLLSLGFILLLVGIFYIYLGKAISDRKQWAKIVQIIVAIMIHLFFFPLGTAIALFDFYVLLIDEKTKDSFNK